MNTAANRTHYPALDGLRGIAILLVVIYHNFDFTHYFFFGWLGVDLFFVLSGFLITDILLRTLGNVNYLRNFYMRRVLRIFPLYYLCLILFLLVIPRLNHSLDLKYYTDNQVWLWTYLQNWLFIFKDGHGASALHHFWSLAVEEQFYLFWPLMILLVRNPRYLLAIVILLLAAVIALRLWIWMENIAELAYSNLYTFTRVDGICIGCMVALIRYINPQFLTKYTALIVTFFAGLNFVFFLLNRSYHFGFPYLALLGYSTFAMLFGLLVHEVVSGNTRLFNYILSIKPLRFLGKISYGFYVFHWPVYLLLTPVLYGWLVHYFSPWWLQVVVSSLATIAAVMISWISFITFERYFLKLKDRFA